MTRKLNLPKAQPVKASIMLRLAERDAQLAAALMLKLLNLKGI